jgi:hypothetical protein
MIQEATMSSSPPETVIAIYRVRAEKEQEFFALLRQHYPVLTRLGLVTDEKPIVYRGTERGGGPIVFEVFTWKDGEAPTTAHHSPEVGRIWEAMGTMVEERDGKPKFEFPHVTKLDLTFDDARSRP